MNALYQGLLFVVPLMVVSTVASGQTTATASDSFPARALTVRQGIGNVAAKLNGGKDVTVAFIGGPITAGGGDGGFATLVARWLRTQYPQRQVRLVNAGFVDGGSPLGAARYERDVLPHEPDLLFVEFAADDTGKEDRQLHIERLVRKAWSSNPEMDIIFLYALEQSHRDDYRAGRLAPAAALHERVAVHYGIPSVVMGLDLLAQLDAGKTRWVEQFYDESRPTPKGHWAYADAVIGALRTLLADETAKSPVKHELKEPLTPGLVLNPATRPATTMPAPPAMVDNSNRKARGTYTMPVIGTHWVGSPDYMDADGRVLWRLFSQSARANGRRLSPLFGLDRSRWAGPMRWFEEWSYFTGPVGVYLAHSPDGKSNNLTAREDDLPIVTFTAPRAGRYLVRIKSAGVSLWGLHKSLALNIVHFPAGQTKGKSIGFHRTQTGIAERPKIELEVQLSEGDDLAFQLDTNATGGGGGAALLDVELTIGWFGE
ncbi:MAG TPA: SGNH/GDSL hydrolase family protein [Tepidisphaeraceae bacterium]|nr:SGNH/GDSL hydrolase family protein [Tepidisphaeraceae bacterium]